MGENPRWLALPVAAVLLPGLSTGVVLMGTHARVTLFGGGCEWLRWQRCRSFCRLTPLSAAPYALLRVKERAIDQQGFVLHSRKDHTLMSQEA